MEQQGELGVRIHRYDIYAATELGRNPVSKNLIQPEHGDEQADARRDCRTRLARPNSQAPTRTGKYPFYFLVQLTTSRIGNRVDPYSCLCLTTYTYCGIDI